MKTALTMMAALMAAIGNDMPCDFLGLDKPKAKPKKVWDSELKCYIINGEPIKKEEGKEECVQKTIKI